MTTRHRLLALVALAAASGCDSTVDPFLRDTPPYSLYGLIVAGQTEQLQQVRVQRIRATVDPPTDPADPGADVSGTLTSTSPSGSALAWTPRVVAYSDGTVGTVFRQTFQPAPDSRLGVVFEDPQERRVRADVVLPPIPEAEVQEPTAGPAPRQRVAWDAPRLAPRVVVDYEGMDLDGRIHAVRVEYGREAFVDGGTTVEVDLLRDLRALREAGVAVTEAGTLAGLKIRMRATALTDDLPPADTVPSEDRGRIYIQGGTVGQVTWSPTVSVL